MTGTARVGLGPFGITANDRTHTVYVVNNANGDSPGTMSVINSATCNGTHTAGCGRHFPTIPVGRSPLVAGIDARTGTLCVTDLASASVTILNGSRCNAEVTSDCGKTGHQQAVSSSPFGVTVNQRTHTVYVTHLFQAGPITILRATQH